MKGVSVIICCYNSAVRLKETLQYLSFQQIKKDTSWEIIVIDNNSSDNTASAAQQIWNSFNNNISFKVISEPQPGLSYARKRGVEEALYEYAIFCDDDNWLDKNYVQTVYDFFETHPNYAAVGGQTEAVFEEGFVVPDWFEEYKRGYAIGQQGAEGDVTYNRGFVWGAGIGFRKSVYKAVINNSFPSLLSDRKGKELSSGGDSEMCLRFIIVGYKIYYTNKLKLKHFLPANRITIPYRLKLLEGFEEADKVLIKYYEHITIARPGNYTGKLKAIIKYWLFKFKLRKLTKTDENLIAILTNYQTGMLDPYHTLMLNLQRSNINTIVQ